MPYKEQYKDKPQDVQPACKVRWKEINQAVNDGDYDPHGSHTGRSTQSVHMPSLDGMQPLHVAGDAAEGLHFDRLQPPGGRHEKQMKKMGNDRTHGRRVLGHGTTEKRDARIAAIRSARMRMRHIGTTGRAGIHVGMQTQREVGMMMVREHRSHQHDHADCEQHPGKTSLPFHVEILTNGTNVRVYRHIPTQVLLFLVFFSYKICTELTQRYGGTPWPHIASRHRPTPPPHGPQRRIWAPASRHMKSRTREYGRP